MCEWPIEIVWANMWEIERILCIPCTYMSNFVFVCFLCPKVFSFWTIFLCPVFLAFFAAWLLSTTCPIRHHHTRTAVHLPVSLSVRPLMLSSSFWCRSLLHAQANVQRTMSWQLFLFARKLFTRWRRFVRWLYHSSIILSTISPSPLRHCLFLFFLSSCLSFSSGRPSDRLFLDASLHLYKRVCPFVRPSVRPERLLSKVARRIWCRVSGLVIPAILSPFFLPADKPKKKRKDEKKRRKSCCLWFKENRYIVVFDFFELCSSTFPLQFA